MAHSIPQVQLASSSQTKWERAISANLRSRLNDQNRVTLERLETEFGFSFQQLRQLGTWLVDCRAWEENSFDETLKQVLKEIENSKANYRQQGKLIFARLSKCYTEISGKPKAYSNQAPKEEWPRYKIETQELKGRIFKLCPAASERAVCCNLKVINIVENCAMGCTYCVLQSHYEEPVIKLPSNLKLKLDEIQLDPNKRYRIGTGEYSDSLLWGNKNNILGDLCDFARKHPNIILELKTKSANIGWLLENPIPANLCCSWSLNPQIVIDNEEHKTVSLKRRLTAARQVADKGIKVGFHLHPMMYFEGWEKAYQELIENVMSNFEPQEILWISLGTVTLMASYIQEIRENFTNSKLLQMQLEQSPDGKFTYPYAVRRGLYVNALKHLAPWRDKVFQYLCMEHSTIWNEVMGFAYPNMAVFDDTFNDSAFAKLKHIQI